MHIFAKSGPRVLAPWTSLSVCMKLREGASGLHTRKGGFKSRILYQSVGFFLLPLKISSLHFEEEESQETGKPRTGGTCPAFPAYQFCVCDVLHYPGGQQKH